MNTGKIAKTGMLLAISLVLSYLEMLLPVTIAVPGVKIGLANIITMFLLYRTDLKSTFMFVCVRVVLAGILFSGISGIIYSLAGGMACVLVMSVLKRFSFFYVLGVSVAGAIAHNVGQIVVAVIVMENIHIAYYLPFLCISGVISGLLVGYLAFVIMKRYRD